MVLPYRRFHARCNERSWIVPRNTDGGESKLGLGPVAHRLDDSSPFGGCGDDDIHGDQDTDPAGKPAPRSVEVDRGPDLYDWGNWTAVSSRARHRVYDLGGGVLVAWGCPIVHGRSALFRGLDEHAGCI